MEWKTVQSKHSIKYHERKILDSIRNFIGNLAAKYRLSIQVLRGFASLSMYRKALVRAAERGVKKILYIGDFDPSGLLIEKVAEKEMNIEVKRLALTFEQVKRFRSPFVPVNRRDSRAADYIAKYGDRCWEVEALRPGTLFKLVEEKLRESVPHEYLVEAEARERAARVARPVTEGLTKMIEREVFHLLKEGRSEEEILAQLASKYGRRLRILSPCRKQPPPSVMADYLLPGGESHRLRGDDHYFFPQCRLSDRLPSFFFSRHSSTRFLI